MGAALLQALRDEHPRAFVLAVAVAPHAGGEVPVQPYNMVLAATALQQTVDAVVLLANDDLLAAAGPSLAAMNAHAAAGLAVMLAPSPGGLLSGLGQLCTWASPAPAWRFSELQVGRGDLRTWLPRVRRHDNGSRVGMCSEPRLHCSELYCKPLHTITPPPPPPGLTAGAGVCSPRGVAAARRPRPRGCPAPP